MYIGYIPVIFVQKLEALYGKHVLFYFPNIDLNGDCSICFYMIQIYFFLIVIVRKLRISKLMTNKI